MIAYEYVEHTTRDGSRVITERVITDWSSEERQRRALKTRLVMLAQVDRDQAVGSLLFKTSTAGIYYAKIRGNVPLRPRLCLGPKDPDNEVTFLQRAQEVNFKIVPVDASRRALEKKKLVEDDDSNRMLIWIEEL